MADDLLARLRRNALIACGAFALIALAVDPQRPAAALGVLGGGVLIAISYVAVAFTFRAFMPLQEDGGNPLKRKRTRTFAVLLFASHYALLALAAYVMIGRLRLHPLGLLGGVTSFVVAVALESRRTKA